MIFFIIFLFVICIILFYLYCNEKVKNKEIKKINEKIEQRNEEIKNENTLLKITQNNIKESISQKQEELAKIQEMLNHSTETSHLAFTNYSDILEKEYQIKEKEFNDAVELLNKSYDTIQSNILSKINEIYTDLNKISSTRTAAIQAQLRENEIQQKQDYYSLSIEDVDKREVKILQSIESELRDPRPIRMIIWTAYYTKKANDLAVRVLGPNEKCGIYKITNKINGLCYIGQAKKIRERWREHMKCGLGIDTPVNNKLYEAMKKEGIDNFTFELLEECAPSDLNEKEAFYINLYSSKDYGYNSTIGNKK